MKENRRNKTDVITISDDDEEPVATLAKTCKKFDASSEVARLQRQVAELEQKYQHAVHALAAAETAKQLAESLLDSKSDVRDDWKRELENELQRRLADILARLEEARQRAEQSTAREIESAREGDAMKVEMIGLKSGKEEAERMRDEIAQENATLKKELEKSQKSEETANNAKEIFLRKNALLEADLERMRGTMAEMQKDCTSAESETEEEDGEWEISCICGIKDDDSEPMVRCDECILRWEHVDCIFPRTRKAPSGDYSCHVCKPRPTELTPEQARSYQMRLKELKNEIQQIGAKNVASITISKKIATYCRTKKK